MDDLIAAQFDEIKPGNSLHTEEWEQWWKPDDGKLRSSRDLEAYGGAMMILALMHLRGWRDLSELPEASELATLLRATPKQTRRVLSSLHGVPVATVKAELARLARWPSWLIMEMAP